MAGRVLEGTHHQIAGGQKQKQDGESQKGSTPSQCQLSDLPEWTAPRVLQNSRNQSSEARLSSHHPSHKMAGTTREGHASTNAIEG
ncbi:hypothetical protein QNM99_17375 [Pseudomonas sp. PCH446]